ncbi:hypothetical protein B0T10DRAFT_611319 [Thelonectria olida]|uniref:Sugar phosphate transporter domain-containing protein n=1 Tax=Thelonectria olida TaxID=1576542 RepID=A0A9P9AHF3_9HYPO|nr:hypothetical protein B0T10DRAFT_611319 [Thelonectria olida]
MEKDYSKLPAPASVRTPSARAESIVHTTIYMLAWILSSNSTILANKWLISSGGFGYPILLTCWHLVFSAFITQILAHTTTLLHSRHSLPISRRFYLRTILPIGLVASGSLVCTNFVYFWLSVAFLQMIKAATPVVMLFVSWMFGVADPTLGNVINIIIIAGGVGMASAGELHFSWIGVAFQFTGILFEATRVVLIQIMLRGEGMKMNPMVGLYYYAPVCAVINFLIACVVEIPYLSVAGMTTSGWIMLLFSAPIAFFLNYTSMALIGKTSGVVMSLAAVFKNILLVMCSVFIWRTKITGIQLRQPEQSHLPR